MKKHRDLKLEQIIEQNDLSGLKTYLEINGKKLKSTHNLRSAIRHKGSCELIKELTQELKIDWRKIESDRGATPLHWAASGGNIEMIRFFVEEAGINPCVENDQEETPLHYVGGSDTPRETILYLIQQKGVNINARSTNNRTPLWSAISAYRNPEAVRCLLDAGADVLAEVDQSENRTALWYGEISEPEDMAIKLALLEAAKNGGFKVMRKNREHLQSVLALAISANDLETITLLADKYLDDLDNMRIKRKSVLAYSIQEAQLPVVRYFTENCDLKWDGTVTTELQWAAAHGNTDVVRYLIEECDYNPHEGSESKEPFEYAIRRTGNIETLKYLIEEHANGERIDFNKLLTNAATDGTIRMVQYLIDQQHADPKTKELGENIFELASKNFDEKTHDFCVLRYLINRYHPSGQHGIFPAIDIHRQYRVGNYTNKSSAMIAAQENFNRAVAGLKFN